MTKLKICGLRRMEDIEAVNEGKPDFAGFIFAKRSRRKVTREEAAVLKQALKPEIRTVAVCVDMEPDQAAALVREGIADLLQLHGSEDVAYIRRLRERTDAPIIQAFRIGSGDDLRRADESEADFILLDHGRGGTGKPFDWSILEEAEPELQHPYFLAGGIGTANMEEALRRFHPYALDMNSALETDGFKDRRKILECCHKIRQPEQK